MKLIGLLGIVVILGIAFALSTDRRAISYRVVGWGLGLQLALALFILKLPLGHQIFQSLGDAITKLLDFAKVGSGFVFGSLVTKMDSFGFIFAFQVLPAIIFVGSLMGIAYYVGLMQIIVSAIAKVMVATMGTSGAESLNAVGTVFVGQSEAPLLIRPYIAEMTRSELNTIMTSGMATIAGSVMAAYIGMLGPSWAPHLLAASIMGAPAGLVLAKILVPETEEPKTRGSVKLEVEKTESSIIEAAAKGAGDGMHLAFVVGAMLVAFISLLAMINGGIGLVGSWFHFPDLSLQWILGKLFGPLAFVMGVPAEDMNTVGGLLGQKIVLNEFVAYSQLSDIIQGKVAGVTLTPQGKTIATYALCGFANFSSIAINIGCIGGIAPERRGDLAKLGLRAMLGGALASCLTATIAGLLS
ncbi:MAG: NupC/NupG family nucleoside transporter [Cyanobacteria bacterium RYN_339]|nr:NupC/NupG family nucleoside transporter [Cyanobacteria bacterium RYN_339]